MNIRINKKKVLNTLKENRQKHIDEFTLQVQGWKEAMEKYSVELAEWRDSISEDIFHSHEIHKRPQEPHKPISYVKDYDKFIELVEHHEGEHVDLEEYEFNQIIKDEFGWKGHFLTNSALYSSNV